MTILENVKKLLNLDDSQEEKLDVIINLTASRLKILLGDVDKIPRQLEYIVTEVSISRFNRIGSEGTSSHTVEGESMTFNDDDFNIYRNDIKEFQKQHEKKGRVMFL